MKHATKHFLIIFIAILTTGFLSGCGKTYSTSPLSPVELFRQREQSALNSSKPSPETMQKLRLMFLDDEYRQDPVDLILQLQDKVRCSADRNLMVALAELSLLQARKAYKHDTLLSASMYIKAASWSYDYLTTDHRTQADQELSPNYRFMADIYNRAVSRLVEIRSKKPDPWVDQLRMEGLGTTYDLTIKRVGPDLWDPSVFDMIMPANQVETKGLNNQYFSRGLGAPLVGFVNKPAEHPLFGRFHPRRGVAYPVTAVLTFEPEQDMLGVWHRKVELEFYDTLLTDTAQINGLQVPLEADYSTPLGVLLSKIQVPGYGLQAMLHSDKFLEQTGMIMLEPYRHDKIPVVMVHGLMSSPQTWVQMFNDLRGDPEIRSKYQFWFFKYPTGLPIIYSASLLRRDLLDIRDKYDLQRKDVAFDQMVVVGHSLGGLLSHILAQDSEDHYWNSVFNKPIEAVELKKSDKDFIESLFFFESPEFVKRIIFIATPHRGSRDADVWFGKLGAGLITLPGSVNVVGEDIYEMDRSELVDPKVFSKRVPNSIIQLSPKSRFLHTMNSVEMDPNIPYHSIIGVRESKTGPGSSDGIVPYESSHLDGAVSEKLVPSEHFAHKHPIAIAEVRRILLEHLEQISDQPMPWNKREPTSRPRVLTDRPPRRELAFMLPGR